MVYPLPFLTKSKRFTQATFREATTGLPAKWRLKNERRNSILMTCYYPDLCGASDWLGICFIQSEARSRGPFLERACDFSGPKANVEIKICWIVARFLTHQPVNPASLTDSFIVSFSKFLKLWSWMQTRQTSNTFPGPKSSGAPNVNFRKDEDDLRSRIFGIFVVKFPACLPLFSNF